MTKYVMLLAVLGALAFAGTASALPAKCAHARLHFSGNGTKRLAPFTVRKGSTLYWQAGGGLFSLISTSFEHPLDVSSQSSHGTTYVDAARYTGVTALGMGSWAFCIYPG
jgi:hypothetical protein